MYGHVYHLIKIQLVSKNSAHYVQQFILMEH